MSEKILRCLMESFFMNGFFITAHDADTEHHEGQTYLWSYEQLNEILDNEEFKKFSEVYHISVPGNFHGANHLLRQNEDSIDKIEEKLLIARRKRVQPTIDAKILSGLNALTASAMIYAGRYLGNPLHEGTAAKLVGSIKNTFWKNNSLGHSMFGSAIQQQPFLFDAAAMLFAVTLLYENDDTWSGFMDELHSYIITFRDGYKWIESKPSDFPPVYASWFDHPAPSSVSLSEMALTRYKLLKGNDTGREEYLQPFQSDFYNLNVMMRNGMFHSYTSQDVLDWSVLPANSLQTRGSHEQDCYMGVCRPLNIHGTV
jgi:uncharacterized protein YyaL (SSP411 family)